jgi:uncharacterized protein (DUF433 family)
MLVATVSRIFEYEEFMLRNKPVLEKGQDIRTLPTYTIPEAGKYLAIESWTLLSWYSHPDPLLKNSGWYGDTQSFALLSFQDIEEAYKVHLLRTKFGYSMQYLRKALVDARLESKSEHPLLDHRMLVFDYLAIEKPANGRRTKQLIPLGAPYQKPLYIPEVVETWGKRIESDQTGKAKQIFPWKDAKTDEVSRPVSINADVLSGRLVVTGTRISVEVLAGYRQAGRNVEEIADLYSLDAEVVRKALQHIDSAIHQAP